MPQGKYSALSRERLEKLFDDSLRKLKGREKDLAGVITERDDLLSQMQNPTIGGNKQDDLTEQLKVTCPQSI